MKYPSKTEWFRLVVLILTIILGITLGSFITATLGLYDMMKPDKITEEEAEVRKFLANCKGIVSISEVGDEYHLKCKEK